MEKSSNKIIKFDQKRDMPPAARYSLGFTSIITAKQRNKFLLNTGKPYPKHRMEE